MVSVREIVEILDEDEIDSGWAKVIRQSWVYTNVNNQAESCLVDIERGYLNPSFDAASLRRVFDNKRELEDYCRERVRLAEFIYNPLKAGVFSLAENGGERLNLYQPPKWKHDNYFRGVPLPPASSAAPSLIDRYLNHLCDGDTASKEYILDWLTTALTGRNFTILTAIGDPGIGKGRLGDIMGKLVGLANFVKVRDDVFKQRFNASLRNKHIVYVDEVAIKTTADANRVKDIVNSRMEIERKGVDAEQVDNHASFYLTSNQMDAVKIEPNDRRFSIIQLTEKPLLSVFTKKEVTELVEDGIVSEFALFLINREVKNDMYRPFRSVRFDQVLEAGLAEWELYLVEDYFAKQGPGTEIMLEQVQARLQENFPYMKVPPGRLKIKELVKKYPKLVNFRESNGKRFIKIMDSAA